MLSSHFQMFQKNFFGGGWTRRRWDDKWHKAESHCALLFKGRADESACVYRFILKSFYLLFYAVLLFHFSLDVCRRRLANQERCSVPSPAFPVDFMFLVALLFIPDTNWPSSSLEKIYTWQRNINRITSCVPLYLLPAETFPKSCQHMDAVPCRTTVKQQWGESPALATSLQLLAFYCSDRAVCTAG